MLIDQRSADGPRVDYAARVNRAIDHVVAHLDQPLRLEDVAAVAWFSPFHFHRVFRTLMGETLQQFVKRLRLERALWMMSHAPQRSLTDVALACGFASSSDFTRSFKQRYDVPPSRFDLDAWRTRSREALDGTIDDATRHHLTRLQPGENPDGFAVSLQDVPPRTMAYIRVLDPYGGDGPTEAYQRLMRWAEERGVAENRWYGYQWDDPEIVALPDCRYDVAVEADDAALEALALDSEVGRFDFPAMQVAELEVRGGIDLVMRALDWLFRTWLPHSGLVPADQPCFEAWRGRPFAHGTEHFEIDIHLPVVQGR